MPWCSRPSEPAKLPLSVVNFRSGRPISREDLGADLLKSLQTSATHAHSCRTGRLLLLLATPALIPELLALVRDRGRPRAVRAYGLSILVAIEACVPLDLLSFLFDEMPIEDPSLDDAARAVASSAPELADLLCLCQSPAQVALARERLAPMARGIHERLWEQLVWREDSPHPDLLGWLEQSLGLSEPPHRPTEEEPPPDADGGPAEPAADPLALPLSGWGPLGPRGLTRAIKAALHERSVALRAGLPGLEQGADRYPRALAALRAWHHGPQISLDLLGEVVLAPGIREDLWAFLLACRRREALRFLARRWRSLDDLLLLRGALRRIALAPIASDGAFLRAALDHVTDDESRYHAIEALEALGEAGPAWISRLYRLVECPGAVAEVSEKGASLSRVRALAALARAGVEAAVQALGDAARRHPLPHARAVAIRGLGQLDHAADFLDLLATALLLDRAPLGPRYVGRWRSLPAEQAAVALGRLASREALQALVIAEIEAPEALHGRTELVFAAAVTRVLSAQGERVWGKQVDHRELHLACASSWTPFEAESREDPWVA